jgi:hypothetical protein
MMMTVAQPSQTKPYRVLICDDQPDVLEALRLLFKGQGWQAVTADSPPHCCAPSAAAIST